MTDKQISDFFSDIGKERKMSVEVKDSQVSFMSYSFKSIFFQEEKKWDHRESEYFKKNPPTVLEKLFSIKALENLRDGTIDLNTWYGANMPTHSCTSETDTFNGKFDDAKNYESIYFMDEHMSRYVRVERKLVELWIEIEEIIGKKNIAQNILFEGPRIWLDMVWG